MRNLQRCLVATLTMVMFASCGYHFSRGSLADNYKTLAVPYALGDRDGHLTAEIVRAVSESGAFTYADQDAEASLVVRVVDVRRDQIGFRFDREADGSFNDRLVPGEGRLTALVEVEVIDARSGQRVASVATVSASADFDHDFYTTMTAPPAFSLGQLDAVEVAERMAYQPLNRAIAKRVVDYLVSEWETVKRPQEGSSARSLYRESEPKTARVVVEPDQSS